MSRQQLKFVIVGHVDHGKSTLIGRLLYDTNSLLDGKMAEIQKISSGLGRETEFAYLLDHLEEERQQGITIDTTQVFFKTDKRQYVIIDAPGHVEFVKNMITGASQADAAVLIVDVVDGVKEQTKRHSYMLSMLGLRQVIVVINKMDLADYSAARFDSVRQDVQQWLNSINIEPITYIPIAAVKGDNIAIKAEHMPWYLGPTFLESLDSLKVTPPSEAKPVLLPIQDVYKVGDKRINAGRVETGFIEKNSLIKILPSGQITTVKSIEKFLKDTDKAVAGECIGFTTSDSVFLERGDIICTAGKEPTLTDTIRANIFWMSKQDFAKNQKLTIRCATQETSCRIENIHKRVDSSTLDVIEQDGDILKNLEVGQVTIKTKKPLAVKDFNDVQELGRFVLVKDCNICAGGIVTNGCYGNE